MNARHTIGLEVIQSHSKIYVSRHGMTVENTLPRMLDRRPATIDNVGQPKARRGSVEVARM